MLLFKLPTVLRRSGVAIHVLIAVSIGLTFAFSFQHPNHLPSDPAGILLHPEHYVPTLQNLQRDHINSDNEVVPIVDGESVARILSHMRQQEGRGIRRRYVGCRRSAGGRSSDSWTPYDYKF
jgi:hypothetical protein